MIFFYYCFDHLKNGPKERATEGKVRVPVGHKAMEVAQIAWGNTKGRENGNGEISLGDCSMISMSPPEFCNGEIMWVKLQFLIM